jgi:hypothetical protein
LLIAAAFAVLVILLLFGFVFLIFVSSLFAIIVVVASAAEEEAAVLANVECSGSSWEQRWRVMCDAGDGAPMKQLGSIAESRLDGVA